MLAFMIFISVLMAVFIRINTDCTINTKQMLVCAKKNGLDTSDSMRPTKEDMSVDKNELDACSGYYYCTGTNY